VLTILCLLIYTLGLTAQGLSNWQEGQRALVAREMFVNSEWIVPTVHGTPYLAKPPLMYWGQMLIGHARSALGFSPFTDETEVRLITALAGLLGVLATYLVARRMLARDPRGDALADHAAWWSALGLATGVLYVRSSRMGEIDVLTVPFIVIAVGCIVYAWRAAERGQRTRWLAIIVAALAATGAVLTKGPPAILALALGGFVAPPVVIAITHGLQPLPLWPLAIAAAIGAAALAAPRILEVRSIADAIGLLIHADIGASIGALLVLLLRTESRRLWLGPLIRTHPWFVLAAPLLAFWGWGRLVAARIGDAEVARIAAAELENNLVLLDLDSPVRNLGFIAYGVAPMTIFFALGCIWLLRRHPSVTVGQAVPLAWTALAFAAFSSLGKGVARYLTPLWPAMAMFGGVWAAHTIERLDARPRLALRRALLTIFLVAAMAQAAWYGFLRPRYYSDRSPREFLSELLPKIDPDRLGLLALEVPAIDFYLRRPVEVWPSNIADSPDPLIDRVRSGAQPYTLVLKRRPDSPPDSPDPILDVLRGRGISAAPIPISAPYAWPPDGQRILAFSLSSPAVP